MTDTTAKPDHQPVIAHRMRVHVSNVQSSWLRQNCIAKRLAYNFAVAKLREQRDWNAANPAQKKFLSAYEISKLWSAERETLYPWMKQQRLVMSGINRAINVNFSSTIANWKRDKWSPDKAPVFHGRGARLSVTWDYTVIKLHHLRGTTLTLPQKMGTVRLACPLRFDGEIRQVTFSLEADKWYASFLIRPSAPIPKPDPAPADSAVGVDVGVVQFASLSDGTQYAPALDYPRELEKLAKLQRELSRMEGPIKNQRKASKNWRKQQMKVAKQHRRIANKRRHYTEVVSKDIAEHFETVAVEDLKIKNMTASAKGDAENPGSKVRQKSGLNRSILNGGFFQFSTRLEAKVSARGGRVVAVNPAYTSQTCPACGHVDAANRPDQATFRCVACGYSQNADIVAAQNILHRALVDATH